MRDFVTFILRYVAIVAFFQGFFLMKRSIDQVATEKNISLESILFGESFEASQQFFEYKNIVLFIIDGLRYDFMKYNINQSCQPLPYNCLSSLHDLLQTKPSQSMFYTLKVDPPTVTSPRLKALTTGSPPTFLSAAANLNSARVQQDNLIQQVARSNNYHLMTFGDDTWKALFPEEFHEYHVFDSFDTRDLDTVDDGIESKLQELDFSTFRKKKFIVLHFLGVDHIGHTYDAFHPFMAVRLQRMNAVMQAMMNDIAFQNNPLFLFMGDHGMTNQGEHGGASFEETTSGLFVHSTVSSERISSNQDISYLPTHDNGNRKSFFINTSPSQLLSAPRAIAQIDLVPFLSLVAQIPIPFGSLGVIPPELLVSPISHPFLPFDSHKSLRLLLGLSANANQVWEALLVYLNKPVSGLWSTLTSDLTLTEKVSHLFQRVENISKQLETESSQDPAFYQLWLLYSQAIRSHLAAIQSHQQILEEESRMIAIAQLYYEFLLAAQREMRSRWTEYNYSLLYLGLLLGIALVLVETYYSWNSLTCSVMNIFLLGCYLFYQAGAGSNSFILQEKTIIFYLVQSLMLLLLSYPLIMKSEAGKSASNQILPYAMIFLFPTLNRYLYQWHLTASPSTSLLLFQSYRPNLGFRIILGLRLIEFMQFSYFGRPQPSSPSPSWNSYYYLFEMNTWVAHGIQLYWFYQREVLQQHQGYLVIIVMVLCGSSTLLLLLLSATTEDMISRESYWRYLFLNALLMISHFYKFQHYCCFWIAILFLHGISPWIGVIDESSGSKDRDNWALLVFFSFWERYVYFLTGHGMTFDTLQLSAAFVMVEKFDFYIGGFSLFLNTFGSLFLVVILLNYHSVKENGVRWKGMTKKFLSLRFCGLIINLITLFALRDHLMLWDVFAPKTIFEITFFFVLSILAWIM